MPTAGAALARLCDPAAHVSSPYVIEEDGTVHALVDEAMRAWHAGQSIWRGREDVNFPLGRHRAGQSRPRVRLSAVSGSANGGP
jgi:hypothetical protein